MKHKYIFHLSMVGGNINDNSYYEIIHSVGEEKTDAKELTHLLRKEI